MLTLAVRINISRERGQKGVQDGPHHRVVLPLSVATLSGTRAFLSGQVRLDLFVAEGQGAVLLGDRTPFLVGYFRPDLLLTTAATAEDRVGQVHRR